MCAAHPGSIPRPKFPPELRHQIWYDALPNKLRPALFQFKKGCWLPGPDPTNPDSEHDNIYQLRNLNFRFHFHLLGNLQYRIPLAYVNTETRSIVSKWAREQSLQIQYKEESQHPVFLRSFNRLQDAIYVMPAQWTDFLTETEYENITRGVDLERHGDIRIWISDWCTIAVPRLLLDDHPECLAKISNSCFEVRTVIVLTNDESNLPSLDRDPQRRRVWELEQVGDWEYAWVFERQEFELRGSKETCSEEELQLVQRAAVPMLSPLAGEDPTKEFAIKLAVAINRY